MTCDGGPAVRMTQWEIDLAEPAPDELDTIDFSCVESVTVLIPLPSIGRTNAHIDICSDYADASWAAEKLAAGAETVSVIEDYVSALHRTRLKLTISRPGPDFRDRLRQVSVVFDPESMDESDDEGVYQAARDEISDYEETLGKSNPLFPEIVDAYHANLVSGAYYQMRYDAPDYYDEQIKKYPERELGFSRSAFSGRAGAECYASPDSWLVPASLDLDKFFEVTEQNYRAHDFLPAEVIVIAGRSIALADGVMAYLPMSQYFKSRVCASLTLRHDEDAWPPDTFDWSDASFTFSAMGDYIRQRFPSATASGPVREKCLVHRTGTLIIVGDDRFNHILYDTRPLNAVEMKKLCEQIGRLAQAAGSLIGLSESKLDWSSIDDEQFEQLCYDIIYAHSKFDSSTIRKLGSSRSRDGGRDIQVYEMPRVPGGHGRKWIFQCKLTRSASLGASKVPDIGDMLEQHDAGGFGVMTSALIDATLYDKLDNLCRRRSIEQLNFSSLELERALIANPSLRKKYFPDG